MTLWETLMTSISNTFRSKLRTTLTILAIFVGAFTLTLTNGAGTGISNYINAQVASIGSGDTLTVTKTDAAATASATTGPQAYNPDAQVVRGQRPGSTVLALTQKDIDAINATPGITAVNPTLAVSPDYVEWNTNGKFQLSLAQFTDPNPLLTAGKVLNESSTADQILLPSSYIKTMGFASAAKAVGQTVTIGITDAAGTQHTATGTVVGVSSATLIGGGATVNNALKTELSSLQSTGLPTTAEKTWNSASASFASGSSDAQITTIKTALSKEGYSAETVKDQLGTFETVINGIILVLNAFAVIALIAAGFGIINTLLMSVQERTREIGLMKAMGMSGGKVFALFSFEAVFIGFLGSAIGSAVGIALGSLVSSVLAKGPLSGLEGLRILTFAPKSVAGVIILVMAIAFLAGTLPALRAARQDPIESLRYE
jgi:putative ABC transport system permease protein